MYYKYGSYTHAANETAATFTVTGLYEGHVRVGYREEWNLTGLLFAATRSALQTALDALDAAYEDDGYDLKLLDDDGTTVLRSLTSASTTSGTMVIAGPSYPDNGETNNEYGTYRRYNITVAAEYMGTAAGVPSFPEDTIVWVETVSITGTGAAQFVLVPILNGRFPRQTLRMNTAVTVKQEGRAIGRTGYPTPPRPLIPQWEHQEQRQISRGPLGRAGPPGSPVFVEWPVSWSYTHELPVKWDGVPNTSPV